MTGATIHGVRPAEEHLENVRSLIAATEKDERNIRVVLVLVHEALRSALAASADPVAADVPPPRFDAERWRIDSHARISAYDALVERVRERTIAVVAPGARIAMVSKGDERLLHLVDRVAEHFPQDDTGRFAGYYPQDSKRAIQQLLDLGCRGVRFVVFPATAFWWFDFYPELARWLAPTLVSSSEDCAVYELGQLMHGTDEAA
jgi:hypothetical protein